MFAYLIDGVDMEYRTLGRSGLRISRLLLGAMTFGAGSGIWGEIAGLDRAQAARLVAVAAEQGINLIDTADVYSQGKSEEVVGQVLSDLGLDETHMLVATKVRLRTGPGPNEVGLGRSHILRSVERSLKRISRDHIDLFQLHDRDALVRARVLKINYIQTPKSQFPPCGELRIRGSGVRIPSGALFIKKAPRLPWPRDRNEQVEPLTDNKTVGIVLLRPPLTKGRKEAVSARDGFGFDSVHGRRGNSGKGSLFAVPGIRWRVLGHESSKELRSFILPVKHSDTPEHDDGPVGNRGVAFDVSVGEYLSRFIGFEADTVRVFDICPLPPP